MRGFGFLGALGFAIYGSLIIVPISIIVGIVAQSWAVMLVCIGLLEAIVAVIGYLVAEGLDFLN